MKLSFTYQCSDQCRLLYDCDVQYISSREIQNQKGMKKVTGYETSQFEYCVTPEVRDVQDMEEGTEGMKNAKAEFIDKVQREKIQRRRSKEIIIRRELYSTAPG